MPLFKRQKEQGILTITDKRMTRFWITYEHAIGLVIKSLEYMIGGEVFVPKIPSMKILELAKAIGPDCELKETGIRLGEKIHEVLITHEEARNTYEFDEYYLIEPQHRWWGKDTVIEGKKVNEDFMYSSDNNGRWLSIEELNEMIKDM